MEAQIMILNGTLGVPVWTKAEWCHIECYLRWTRLEPETQGLLGGHVHYDVLARQWRVPHPKPPLRMIGTFKTGPDGEVIVDGSLGQS